MKISLVSVVSMATRIPSGITRASSKTAASSAFLSDRRSLRRRGGGAPPFRRRRRSGSVGREGGGSGKTPELVSNISPISRGRRRDRAGKILEFATVIRDRGYSIFFFPSGALQKPPRDAQNSRTPPFLINWRFCFCPEMSLISHLRGTPREKALR